MKMAMFPESTLYISSAHSMREGPFSPLVDIFCVHSVASTPPLRELII